MNNAIEKKLESLGLILPVAPPPAANYVPFTISGKYIYVSGQVSSDENGFICGKLGSDISIEDGYKVDKRRKGKFFSYSITLETLNDK